MLPASTNGPVTTATTYPRLVYVWDPDLGWVPEDELVFRRAHRRRLELERALDAQRPILWPTHPGPPDHGPIQRRAPQHQRRRALRPIGGVRDLSRARVVPASHFGSALKAVAPWPERTGR